MKNSMGGGFPAEGETLSGGESEDRPVQNDPGGEPPQESACAARRRGYGASNGGVNGAGYGRGITSKQ